MSKRKMTAAAASAGVPNPPFEFHCPLWYADIHYYWVERFGGEFCLHHNLCIEGERDMRLLRRQSQPQTEEEVEKKMEEEEDEGSIEEEDEWSTIDEEWWIDEEEGSIDEEEDCTLELASLDTSSSFRHGFVEEWTVKMDEPYIILNLFSNSKYLVNCRGKKLNLINVTYLFVDKR